MNIQKLISQLQSRVADRKWEIAMHWNFYHMYAEDCEGKDRHRNRANDLGKDQKLDKQLLKALCNITKERKQAFFAGCDWMELINKDEK